MANQQLKTQGQTSLRLTRFFMNSITIMVMAFMVVVFTLNAVFMEPLFQLGVNIIYQMQVGFQSKAFQQVMNVFSIICNTPVIGAIFLLQMGIVKHKFKVLVHLSFFLLGFHVIAILKQAYQQSRPIWVTDKINRYEWFCPTDFGNPSGHSYVSFPLFEPIIQKYMGFQNWRVAWLFLIFFGIVVPYSRMYLGVHSLNQVFFGFSFGLAWTLLYRYGLRKMFFQVFSRLLKLKKWSHLYITVLVHLILTAIPVIIFRIRSFNTPLAQADLINLNRQCVSSIDSFGIQNSMLGICILHSPVFGFMYGFFALKCRKEDKLYFSGRWSYRNKLSTLLHCIAQILTAGVVPAIVILGIGSIWHQPYSKFFVFNLALAVGGFLYIWLTPKLERKYKWIEYQYDQGIKLEFNPVKSAEQNLNQKELYDQMNKDNNFFIVPKTGQSPP